MREPNPITPAVGLAPTFENAREFEIPSDTLALIQTIKATCRLPSAAAWQWDEGWQGFDGFMLGLDSARTKGYARQVLDHAGALEALKALDVTPGLDERDEWFAANGFSGMLKGFEGRGDQFMLVAARTKIRGVEGTLLGERSIDLHFDPGAGLSLTYSIDAKMAYVLPQARGKGVGRILAVALGRMVRKDFEYLEAQLPEEGLSLDAYIYGEAQSEGGMAILNRIADEMDVAGDLTEGPGIEVVRDYGY